jgi:hypothetical protein
MFRPWLAPEPDLDPSPPDAGKATADRAAGLNNEQLRRHAGPLERGGEVLGA